MLALPEILLQNQFLQGAGLVGVGGMAIAYAKTAPRQLWSWARNWRRRTVIIDREGNSDLFLNVLKFVDRELTKKVKSISIELKWDNERARMQSSPNDQLYKYKYNKKTIYISLLKKESSKGDKKDDDNGSTPRTTGKGLADTLGVEIYSYRHSLAELHGFLQHMVDEINKTRENRPRIFNYTHGWWSEREKTEFRSIKSLVFNDQQLIENLKDDMANFLSDREWYRDMGIPHRRGYLLYGEPGNGKTSLIRALASELGFGIAPINLAHVTDEKLETMLAYVPKNTIILFEDIDAMFSKNGLLSSRSNKSMVSGTMDEDDEDDVGNNENSSAPPASELRGLSFSGLLNALDGISSSENRIIVMTTNYVEHLDAALIRPGRCDVKVYIGNPNKVTIARMFDRFFPQSHPEDRRAFVNQFKDDRVCMAQVQEKLLILRETMYRKTMNGKLFSVNEIEINPQNIIEVEPAA